MEYVEKKGTVEVPRNVGIKGFLLAIEGILKLPRVQDINIDARGKVHYRHFAREEETNTPLRLDFDGISPYSIIRNGKVTEVEMVGTDATTNLARAFELASMDHVFPIAWVASTNTRFWKWFEASYGFRKKERDELFGYPFLTEPRHIPEDVILLCTGYARGGEMSDTQCSYKLMVPQVP